MDRETVKYIARLSNIFLSETEEEKISAELKRIVEYVSKIKELSEDIEIIEEKKTPMREDEVKEGSLSISCLSNYIEDNQFRVPLPDVFIVK